MTRPTAARRSERMEASHAKLSGADACSPHSMEYRECHRGHMLRVAAAEPGSYGLIVEEPHEAEEAQGEILASLRREAARRYASMSDAIAALDQAKAAIDAALSPAPAKRNACDTDGNAKPFLAALRRLSPLARMSTRRRRGKPAA